MESIARYCNGQHIVILIEFSKRLSADGSGWKST